MKAFLAAALLWLVFDGSNGDGIDCSRGLVATCIEAPIDFIGELAASDSKAEAILRLCPSVKQYINCSSTYAKSCPSEMQLELTDAFANLVGEICDPKTLLHQVFANNVECLLGERDEVPACSQLAKEQEEKYSNYYSASVNGEEDIRQLDKETDCLNKLLTVGCMRNKVKDKCGEAASDLIVELAERAEYLCSDEDGAIILIKYLAMASEDHNDVLKLFKRSTRTK